MAAVLALASCSLFSGGDEPDEVPEPSLDVPEITILPIPSAVPLGDGRFSLRYNVHATFNPLIGTDADNMLAAGLMYETLFVLNENFEPQPALCESYTTEDAITYDFTFREGAYMSDGEPLTAYDIIYSINMARNNPKYRNRLRNISAVSIGIGSRVVRITLKSPDARFPALLDIAIIKDGTAGLTPRGSGPYRFDGDIEGIPRLVKNQYYSRADELPLNTIYLVTCRDAELGERFTERTIDLFVDNPNSTVATVRRDHEIRYYDTTVLQYVGFNPRVAAIDNAAFRAAVALAVDRSMIVSDILGTRATEAQLAFPKAYRLYDRTWEQTAMVGDAFIQMSDLLEAIGLADSNSDTYLEFPVDGEMVPFALDFIVANENQARVAAARSVAATLRRAGINILLRELPFSEFETALEGGEFDICYAETRITANFDFSPLIASGGALNYGGITGFSGELAAFAAARGDFAERNAARELAVRIRDDVPFIPVAYLQYAVHSGRNEITGIIPSQTGVFWSIADWTMEIK